MRIIVGVDASETAYAAARRAAEIAEKLGGELKVVSAYDKFEGSQMQVGSDKFAFSSEDDALQIAVGVISRLKQDVPGAQMTPVATVGKPGEALVALADQIDAEMIVVGNKRVQGITRVLGSIARDITAQASCDVYVVNTHGK